MHQHAQITPNHTAQQSPFGNSSRYGRRNSETNGLNHFGIPSTAVPQRQTERQIESNYDQADMERAFEVVSLEQAEAAKSLSNIDPAHALVNMHSYEEIHIGSDTILNTEAQEEQKHESKDESNELARTAGQLLDNLKHDHSQKFQNSSFLSLMRQLRDREVHVEGDKLVDVSPPWPFEVESSIYSWSCMNLYAQCFVSSALQALMISRLGKPYIQGASITQQSRILKVDCP